MRKVSIRLPFAGHFNAFIELIDGNFAILVEVSQFCDLAPEVGHDFLILLVDIFAPLSLGLNDGVPNSQAFKVVFVEETVVVDVVHVADYELDTVIPAVCHFA